MIYCQFEPREIQVNAGDNDHMRRTTIAPSAENDSALPLLFLTSPIDFPDAQMDLFTKDAVIAMNRLNSLRHVTTRCIFQFKLILSSLHVESRLL